MVSLDADKRPIDPADPTKWNRRWVFGKDKFAHFGAAAVGTMFLYYLGLPIWVACALTIAVFYGKEVWDGFGNGNPDIWDFVCSLMGALLMAIIIAICTYKKERGTG